MSASIPTSSSNWTVVTAMYIATTTWFAGASDEGVGNESNATEFNIACQHSNSTDNANVTATIEMARSWTYDCGRYYSLIMSFLIGGGLCVFGWITNSLSLVIMWPERNSSPTSFTLIVLAVVDNLLLVSRFLMRPLPALCLFGGWCQAYMMVWKAELKAYVWPLVNTFQMMTAYVTVLVTGIRYLAVCMPQHSASMATIGKVRVVRIAEQIQTSTIIASTFGKANY